MVAKNRVSTRKLLTPAGRARVTSNANATAWTQRGESVSRNQTFAVKVVPSSQTKECYLCLVPALHQVSPRRIAHHRLVLQHSLFAQRKRRLWNWPSVACSGCFVADGLHVKKKTKTKPLSQTFSRNFSYSHSGPPLTSLSERNVMRDYLFKLLCLPPPCYCKSSLEATRMTPQKIWKNSNKITATAQSLFVDCLLLLLLCAQSWYSAHYSCNRHKEPSHTSSPEHCLWSVSTSCP